MPGDMVTITGIVKVTGTEERKLSLNNSHVYLSGFHIFVSCLNMAVII